MRVKTGVVRRRSHKKVLERTKGFRMTKGRLIRVSKEADLHAGHYAFVGRRLRKRDMRKLWIIRINAALQLISDGPSYSKFISALKLKNVSIDRKILAELAVNDSSTFNSIVSFTTAK